MPYDISNALSFIIYQKSHAKREFENIGGLSDRKWAFKIQKSQNYDDFSFWSTISSEPLLQFWCRFFANQWQFCSLFTAGKKEQFWINSKNAKILKLKWVDRLSVFWSKIMIANFFQNFEIFQNFFLIW